MRKRTRVTIAAVSSVALTALAAPAVSAWATEAEVPTECELELLEVPDDSGYVYLNTMDSSGTYMFGTHEVDQVSQLYLWGPEGMEPVDLNATYAEPQAVNSSGHAVGHYIDLDTRNQTPFLYRDGEVEEPAAPEEAVKGSRILEINDDGVMAGSVYTADGEAPAYWPTPDAEAVLLELPEDATGGESFVRGIDSDGRMVGGYRSTDGKVYPHLWDAEGNGEKLPESADGPFAGSAYDIAGDYIVGSNATDDVSMMWSPDSEFAEPLDGIDVRAVNADGTAVGLGEGGGNATLKPLDGEVIELPGIVDEPQRDQARAISADGTQVAGSAIGDGGRDDHNPAVWHCS